MKTQVTTQSVKDFIKATISTTNWSREIIEAIQIALPQIETGDEAGAIQMAVLAKANRDSNLSQEDLDDFGERTFHCIRELDYYKDKRAVVEAALVKIKEIQSKENRLNQMQQQIRKIFMDLDPRTKAILELRRELVRVDGCSTTDYANLLDDFESVDVDVLRIEPELAPLLEAYDMARVFNQVMS